MADDASFSGLTLDAFGERLASAEPVPGGGSASAIAGSLGAALAVMVARLSQDRPKYVTYGATHARVLAAGERARTSFLELADDDAAAYSAFVGALKLPRQTDAEQTARRHALARAAHVAIGAPLETMRLCRATIDLVEALVGRSNVNASSDLDVAALLLAAAAAGGAANVRVNLPATGDPAFQAATEAEVADILEGVRLQESRIHRLVASGEAREPEPE
ncbi:MAG: cyclodeaminase/cyclohydrolase family protein [Candidatus Limnocylindrales bacterium]